MIANEIFSAGVACTDTDQMAGCVLGGGTAVNAGLWWKVNISFHISSLIIMLIIVSIA